MTRLAVFNCKGGVGKTTTTMNLGAALAREGKAVCLIDMDPQAHLTRIFDLMPKDAEGSIYAHYSSSTPLRNLLKEVPDLGTLLPAHGQLMKVDSLFGKGPSTLNRLKLGLEALEADAPRTSLIDCCPYVGVLSLSAIFACDAILIPVASDYLSLQGAQQISHALKALEPVLKRITPRRYVLTRYDRRRRMSEDVRNRLRDLVGDQLCETVISESVGLAISPSLGQHIYTYDSGSRGAEDYRNLLTELRSMGFVPPI